MHRLLEPGFCTSGTERVYNDLRSTYAIPLSAGGVADERVTQMLRQGDAQVFKKYSQMKLQMKREALEKNKSSSQRDAGAGYAGIVRSHAAIADSCTVRAQSGLQWW